MRIIADIISYITIVQAFFFVFALDYFIAKKKIRRLFKIFLNLSEVMFAVLLGILPSWLISINYNVNRDDILLSMVILDILISKIAVNLLIKFGIKIPDFED